MRSYKDLKAEIAQLEKEAAAAHAREIGDALQEIRAKMKEYGITITDIESGWRPKRTTQNAGLKVAPKYRNPATGDTWTGRGKPPRWIAGLTGQDRDQFLIR